MPFGEIEILELLNQEDNVKLIKTLQELTQKPEWCQKPEVIDKLKSLSKSKDIAIRFWAKKVLNTAGKYYFQNKELIQNQEKQNLLKDVSPDLPVSILIQKLKNIPSTFVSLELIKKLCKSKDQEALDLLKTYLSNCNDKVQISYLTKNIGLCYPSEENLVFLMPYLKHDDDRVVANTIEGIEGINSPKGIVVLSQLLEHKSNRVRTNAAIAINRFDSEKSYRVLSRMLSHKSDIHFRISACHAIKVIKDNRFLESLEAALNEELLFPDALSAIEAIGGQLAISILTKNYSNFQGKKQLKIEQVIANLSRLEKKPFEKIGKKISSSNLFSKIYVEIEDYYQKLLTKLDKVKKNCQEAKSYIIGFRFHFAVFLILLIGITIFFYWPKSSSKSYLPVRNSLGSNKTSTPLKNNNPNKKNESVFKQYGNGNRNNEATNSCKSSRREDFSKTQDKNGLVYIKNEATPYTGIIFELWDDGKLLWEKNYIDGKLYGLCKRWYENGQLKTECIYKNGEQNGLCKSWYENGQLKTEYTSKNNKVDGLYKEWYESGQLMMEAASKDGEMNGPAKLWYENGQLKFKGNYLNGEMDGLCKLWHENGEPQYEGTYKGNENKFYGTAKIWDEKGKHTIEVNNINKNSHANPVLQNSLSNQPSKKNSRVVSSNESRFTWRSRFVGEYQVDEDSIIRDYIWRNTPRSISDSDLEKIIESVISGIPKRRKITTRKHLTQAQIKDGMRQLCGHWIMFSAYVKEVKDTTNDYCVVECWDNSNKVSDKYFLTIEKEIALKLAKDHRVTFIGELVEIAENVNIEYKYPEKVETPYLEHAVRGAIFLNAIFYSIEVKSFELFKFFLDSGYNPDSQERNSRPGHTPIFDLVKLYDKNKFKTEEAIKLLVDHGANINAYYKQNFYIPAPSEESKGRFTEDNATVLDVVMNAKSAKIIDNNRIETHYKKKNDMRNLKIHETYRKPQFIEALRQFEARIRLLRSYGAKTYAEIQSGG